MNGPGQRSRSPHPGTGSEAGPKGHGRLENGLHDVLWEAQLVLRALVEEPPPGSESLRDDLFYQLADQVDRIHNAPLFRKEQLNQSQGGMCICRVPGIGPEVLQQSSGL